MKVAVPDGIERIDCRIGSGDRRDGGGHRHGLAIHRLRRGKIGYRDNHLGWADSDRLRQERGHHAAQLTSGRFGEPDVAIGADGYAGGAATGRDTGGVFGDGAAGGDAADLVGGVFREPEVAVRAGGYAREAAGWRQAAVELGQRAGGGHASDGVGAGLGEPKIAVGAGCDARGV